MVYWIRTSFGFTHYNDYLSILDCRFQTPPHRRWCGPQLYYEGLATLSELASDVPCCAEAILNTPFLKTKFDQTVADAGFLVVKDLFSGNEPFNIQTLGQLQIQAGIKRKLVTIIRKLPVNWIGSINRGAKM